MRPRDLAAEGEVVGIGLDDPPGGVPTAVAVLSIVASDGVTCANTNVPANKVVPKLLARCAKRYARKRAGVVVIEFPLVKVLSDEMRLNL